MSGVLGSSSLAYLPCGISLFDLCSSDGLLWVDLEKQSSLRGEGGGAGAVNHPVPDVSVFSSSFIWKTLPCKEVAEF